VQAYVEENQIETTLINGKIQVQIDGRPDKKIVLTPNEKLTVYNQIFHLSGGTIKGRKELSFKVQEVSPMEKIDQIPEVAWMQDKLAFQRETFDRLAKSLERRYNVHIIFRDKQLSNEKLTGVFENETIQKALKILQMTTPFDYRIKNDTVYLRGSD
jgi:ferric-dicitrate binding protein FerR (iron transport regulator)